MSGPCVWLCVCVAVAAAGPPASPPLSELRSQLSGVEELLEEFRKQLLREEEEETSPPPPVPVPVPVPVPADSCVHSFGLMKDSIIRTKDSLSAGAAFLSAPAAISSPSQCLHSCCTNRHCSLAVVGREPSQARGQPALNCYLFNCTYRNRNVCEFSPHQGYSSFSRAPNNTQLTRQEPARSDSHSNSQNDVPPQSDAGQDVTLLLPTDWAVLDGRGSVDDHGIVRYEWTLLQGDPSVDLKSPQPGMLKLTNLQEGVYVVQLSVTDTVGQKSSDNVTVNVMPQKHQTTDCTGVCRRYQFICDDGCCIDITLACDGTAQCPDESDEAFCQSFNADRKPITHTTISDSTTQSRTTGFKQNNATRSSVENSHQALMEESRPLQAYDSSETQSPVVEGGGKPDTGSFGGEDSPETSSVETSEHETIPKLNQEGDGHPVPESGAVLPLALGLAITALLLLMVGCRLRLVRQKLKKARPISSEESDYLINGMYL